MNTTAIALKFQDNHPAESDFAQEALDGLLASRKKIAPKFFYDETGSRLFDAICKTEEYYPTRTESSIIRDNVEDIARHLGRGCLLVEPGSGNSAKVRELLDAVKPHSYLPMDISKVFLKKEAEKLAQEFPWLNVHAVCSDFTVSMTIPFYPTGVRRVAFFPGSSIGNFEPSEATEFLKNVREMVGKNGGLLIGVDLKKDISTLNAAYNDKAGVTAKFNMNLLTRMNKELGANFDANTFEHEAFYNEEEGRIEMHLASLEEQTVKIGNHQIDFELGETIHTENSYKYSLEEFEAVAKAAGFHQETVWTDTENKFSLQYFSGA
ncbi:MAG: L-histidine N(alpha)-methyltransferase [Kordiimonas sp.]